MHIEKIAIKNFRLLKDSSLSLQDQTTVIVGRNNCGKTSLTEIFRRFSKRGKFKLEDFSQSKSWSFRM
jgi:predicted ATP-dependent endonuclease of OLD family